MGSASLTHPTFLILLDDRAVVEVVKELLGFQLDAAFDDDLGNLVVGG